MKRKIAVTLILCLTIVAIFTIGCVEEKHATAPTPIPTPTPTPIPAVTSTLTTDGLQVTVNSVRKDDGEALPDYQKPDSGYTFLIVSITIENIGDEKERIYHPGGMMNVYDEEGYRYGVGLLMPEEVLPKDKDFSRIYPQLSPGDDEYLQPKQEIVGEVGFEVPKTSKGLQLIYWGPPSFEKLIWDLGV